MRCQVSALAQPLFAQASKSFEAPRGVFLFWSSGVRKRHSDQN
jgi:hypothetical protein